MKADVACRQLEASERVSEGWTGRWPSCNQGSASQTSACFYFTISCNTLCFVIMTSHEYVTACTLQVEEARHEALRGGSRASSRFEIVRPWPRNCCDAAANVRRHAHQRQLWRRGCCSKLPAVLAPLEPTSVGEYSQRVIGRPGGRRSDGHPLLVRYQRK